MQYNTIYIYNKIWVYFLDRSVHAVSHGLIFNSLYCISEFLFTRTLLVHYLSLLLVSVDWRIKLVGLYAFVRIYANFFSKCSCSYF